jgi:hypothetical protein
VTQQPSSVREEQFKIETVRRQSPAERLRLHAVRAAGSASDVVLGPWSRAAAMQAKLHRWAAADPGSRFDDLFNVVCGDADRGVLQRWRVIRRTLLTWAA